MDRLERKQIKHDAFVDGTMSFVERLEHNPKPFLYGAVAVLAAFFGTLGIFKLVEARGEAKSEAFARAQAALFAPVVTDGQAKPEAPFQPTFASPSERAEAARTRLAEASSGSTGKLADLMRGAALLEAGQTDEAIALLESTSRSLATDETLAGPAQAALAAAYAQAGRADEAISTLEPLANAPADSSSYPRDLAIASQARLLESAGKLDEARAKWQAVVDADPQSPIAVEARRAVERLQPR